MDFDITVVGIIILLTIVIPVAYIIILSAGKAKKARNAIVSLAKEAGISPEKIEVIGNLILALDRNNKKLMYSYKDNLEKHFKVIPLSDLRGAQGRSRKNPDGSIAWVGLELVGKTGNSEITFYRDDTDDETSRDPLVCLQDTKRWETEILPLVG